MPVTEALMSPGSWSVTLSPNTPRTIIDALSYFQHIVVSTGRHNPQFEGSSLFTSGRFTGVITGLDFQTLNQGRGPVISGDCMASWLGNGSKVGPVIEGNNTPGSSGNGAIFTSASYSSVVNTLVGVSSLKVGTISAMPTSATYTGTFIWKTVADALTSFATQITQGSLPTQIAEWRANNNATVDFGPVASMYRTTPIVAIVPNAPGLDMNVRGLDGVAELIEDVKDYTTRVVVLAGGSGASTAVGTANSADVGASNPYTDFYGNPIVMTRMISASGVSSVNATVSAQAALVPYTTPADQVRLSSSEYDIKGDLQCGDYVWLYDPDAGFVDPSGTNQIVYRGQRINPTKQRVIQVDWPITSDMTVAYRDQSGVWYDLTDYVQFEDNTAVNLTVGGYNRNLVSTSEPVGARPIPDTTIPGVPAFGAFSSTVYQGPSDGKTQAQIQLNWSTPTNTDGTTMTDLSHYEIQYRPDLGIFAQNPTYNALQSAGYTYNALAGLGGSYNQLIPQALSNWKVTFVGGGVNNLLIQELTPGVLYDFQIRAVDVASPPNYGNFSAVTTFRSNFDIIAPPTPDAPTVASNMASVQVTWDCGSAGGGTFNQPVDLNHIEVHGSYEPLFTPTTATKLGNVQANIANITGQIPVVASFTIPPGQPPAQNMYVKIIAVDNAGNKSNPSVGVGSTATLWSNAYITDLSVSKLTAGTVTASVILGGSIGTASAGQRAVMDSTGFHSYNSLGNLVFDVNPMNTTITLAAGVSGGNAVIVDCSGNYPNLLMYDISGAKPAFINAVEFGSQSGAGIGVNSSQYNSALDGTTAAQRLYLVGPGGIQLACIDGSQLVHGGEVALGDTLSRVGMQVHGSTVGYCQFTYNAGHNDAQLDLVGFGPNAANSAAAANQYNFSGFVTGLAGTGGLGIGWGMTMVSGATVVASVLDPGNHTSGSWLSSSTSTGASITWTGVTTTTAYYSVHRVR